MSLKASPAVRSPAPRGRRDGDQHRGGSPGRMPKRTPPRAWCISSSSNNAQCVCFTGGSIHWSILYGYWYALSSKIMSKYLCGLASLYFFLNASKAFFQKPETECAEVEPFWFPIHSFSTQIIFFKVRRDLEPVDFYVEWSFCSLLKKIAIKWEISQLFWAISKKCLFYFALEWCFMQYVCLKGKSKMLCTVWF